MANVLLAAALLSGILAVSGCVGPLPGIGGYGYGGGGGYPSYGGGQPYPYDPGAGGGYAQPVQPYYQPQPYAYSGAPGVYVYPPAQPVPQAAGEHASALPGRWIDRRQQGRIRGAEGRMRADGNLSPQERARLNAMQQRSSQAIYRQRHNGVKPGPTATPAHEADATYGAIAPGGATASRNPNAGRSATTTQRRQARSYNDRGAP